MRCLCTHMPCVHNWQALVLSKLPALHAAVSQNADRQASQRLSDLAWVLRVLAVALSYLGDVGIYKYQQHEEQIIRGVALIDLADALQHLGAFGAAAPRENCSRRFLPGRFRSDAVKLCGRKLWQRVQGNAGWNSLHASGQYLQARAVLDIHDQHDVCFLDDGFKIGQLLLVTKRFVCEHCGFELRVLPCQPL